MNIYEILKEKREEIIKISEKHGAYNIRVFGSVARNEADEKSDVDLIIDIGENTSFFFPGGLIIELESLLGRKVDIVTEKGLKQAVRNRVLKEAKAI